MYRFLRSYSYAIELLSTSPCLFPHKDGLCFLLGAVNHAHTSTCFTASKNCPLVFCEVVLGWKSTENTPLEMHTDKCVLLRHVLKPMRCIASLPRRCHNF